MPSFSLVRRFGKQRKATLDSPMSSAPVGQHIGHPIPGSSDHRTRQDFPVVNAGSGSTVNNAHGLLSGSVALSQHVEGVSIKNITGPVMSNNRVHIINNYGSQSNFDNSDFAMLRVGDIHLEEEIFEEEVWSSNYPFIFNTRYKGKIASSTSVMSIWSYCGMRPAEEFERAYQVYASLPRHPNILQLYGICRSPHLTALVFHGASSLMHRLDYCKTLPSSQWMTHYLKFHQQHESAHNMLKAHNLHGWILDNSLVDETGKLVIAYFFPGPLDDFDLGTHIWTAFETNTFIKEDLLDYYKFLFMMMDPDDCHASTPGLLDKADAFQLSHPEINLPAYCLPGGNNLVLEVNGVDTTVEETGIVVTLLPNMTIRCCIPTPQIPTFSIAEQLWLFNQIVMPSIAIWASQANHLIHNLPINIMDLQTEFYLKVTEFWCHAESFEQWHWRYAEYSEHLYWRYEEPAKVTELLETTHLYLFCLPNKDNIYWSRDEEGRHVIEDSLIRAAFGIAVYCDWDWYTKVFRMPPQCYEILRTIHEGCGFDPYSTQVADYLGLPLAAIDVEHSGLEEYVEDAKYTSESESGDSDYVSASEDV